MERIQTFIYQLSTYDERIKQTISEKKIGGYLSIENCEDEEKDDEDENKEDSIFEFRYNLIVDRMGNSNQLEDMAVKRALEYKTFCEKNQRKPSHVLNGKKKDNTIDEQKYEHRLAQWFSNMKESKKGKVRNCKLYPSVEKILIELLGKSWYDKTDFEDVAFKHALEYKRFYEEKQRYPVAVLKETTQEQKDNAIEEQKYEHTLALWFQGMKMAKRGVKTTKRMLYPSVEKFLIELLGKNWCSSLEDESFKFAVEYTSFYQEKKRKPSKVLNSKTKEQKDNATEEKKHEHKLAQWFGNMKSSKKGKSRMNVYPSVEKMLVEILGSDWFV